MVAENILQSRSCPVQNISHHCGKAFSHKPTQSEAGKVNKSIRRKKKGEDRIPGKPLHQKRVWPTLTCEPLDNIRLACVLFSYDDVVLRGTRWHTVVWLDWSASQWYVLFCCLNHLLDSDSGFYSHTNRHFSKVNKEVKHHMIGLQSVLDTIVDDLSDKKTN